MTLTRAQLNRTLLARQLLLGPRESHAPLSVIERLAGLQAQQARPPFIGLWTRIKDFRREDLHTLLASREAVRATAMRGTLHLMSSRDYPATRIAMQPALTAGMHAILRERAVDLDIAKLTKAATKVFAKKPSTFAELREHLTAAFPGLDERAMGYAVRMHLPVVTVPEPGGWAFTGDSPFELAKEFAGDLGDNFVQRYLSAFGPATPMDFQAWSGLKNAKELFAQTPGLIRYRDEKKRELFDIPDAPMPDPETAVAPRFIAPFDNIVLGHNDRTRIIADEHRPRIVTRNLLVLPTFLVDGYVAGTWQTAVVKKKAILTLSPFAKLTKKTQKQLEEEAQPLVRFVEPDAAGYDIEFKPESV